MAKGIRGLAIVDIVVAEPFRLDVLLADGHRARVDVQQHLWGPVFEPLRDPAMFAQGKFEPEFDTIVWPNGADFSPEFILDAALAARNAAR